MHLCIHDSSHILSLQSIEVLKFKIKLVKACEMSFELFAALEVVSKVGLDVLYESLIFSS